jgi:hypothetical protein
MPKKDYITFKTKEHKNQVMLQQQAATGLQTAARYFNAMRND